MFRKVDVFSVILTILRNRSDFVVYVITETP